MLGLTPPTAPSAAAKSQYVTDSSDATFMADVIEASREVPVIVDFWAPWCGPCKTLGPMLETAVDAAGGKVRMVKIDIDQHPAVAGQLRVQSIPAVFAFLTENLLTVFKGHSPARKSKHLWIVCQP